MKKAIISIVFTVLTLFGLCSCGYGAYTTVMSVETSTLSEKAMSYEKFNGYKSYKFKVDEDETVTVAVKFTSESGKLSAYIAKDNDKSRAVYEGNDVPTSEFTVNITDSGDYTIRLDAENHKGSYSFKINRA